MLEVYYIKKMFNEAKLLEKTEEKLFGELSLKLFGESKRAIIIRRKIRGTRIRKRKQTKRI